MLKKCIYIKGCEYLRFKMIFNFKLLKLFLIYLIMATSYLPVIQGQVMDCFAMKQNISGCEIWHVRQLSYNHFCNAGPIDTKYPVFLKPDMGYRNTKIKFMSSAWETGITLEADVKQLSDDFSDNWNEICLAEIIEKGTNKHWILLDKQPRQVQVLQTVSYNPNQNITLHLYGSLFISQSCDPRSNTTTEPPLCSLDIAQQSEKRSEKFSLGSLFQGNFFDERKMVVIGLFALLVGSNVTLVIVVIIYLMTTKRKRRQQEVRNMEACRCVTTEVVPRQRNNFNSFITRITPRSPRNLYRMSPRNFCRMSPGQSRSLNTITLKTFPSGRVRVNPNVSRDDLSEFDYVSSSQEDLQPQPVEETGLT